MTFIPKILVVSNLQTTSPLWSFHSTRMQAKIMLQTDPAKTMQSWMEKSPDIVIFDLALEDITMMELITELRYEAVIPILLLTSNRNEAFMLDAYQAGVDECIPKPITPALFDAKLKAWLRRSSSVPFTILDPLKLANFRLVPANRMLVINEKVEIRLTNLEVRLLYYLMGRPGKTVAMEELCERVWGNSGEGNVTTLKNVVYRLRRKIEMNSANPSYLRTIAGVGYQFATS